MTATTPIYNGVPFGQSGLTNTIPTTTATFGKASFTAGFPNETMLDPTSGGIAPDGKDINGVLNYLDQHTVWQTAGGQYYFNSTLASAVGGYAVGAIVMADNNSQTYINTTSGNTTNPNIGGAGWNVFMDATLRSNLASTTGSTLITHQYSLTGATPYPLSIFMNGFVTPLGFMSTAMQNDVLSGALTMDHTAAVQLAINSGRNVDLLGLSYKVNNLTQSTNGQSIVSSQGIAKLTKRANGAVLTSSADNFRLQNIAFYGDSSTPAFTGDGIVLNGRNPVIQNCGSRWMAGRALKATGNAVQIIGTCDIYQTTDATASGYDIELGVIGTATLYHEIVGIYTSQATGGVLANSCGTWGLSNSQFGKLTVLAGGAPGGTSAPRVVNNRINGAISTDAANGVFSANQFSGGTITFAAGSGAGTVFDLSNILEGGTTIVNNTGFSTAPWAERIVTGSDATSRFAVRYGGDSSLAVVRYDPADGSFCPDSHVRLKPQKNIYMRNAANTGDFNIMGLDGSNVMTVGSSGLAGLNLQCGTGTMYIGNSAGTQLALSTGVFKPFNDNNTTLGAASQRWSTVYAGTGTINTSDERLKQQWRSQSEAEKAAALEIKSSIGLYKFNDAVAEKGDSARWHVGVKAQQVVSIMQSHGLDALAYGFVCYDEWDEVAEIKSPAHEKVVSEDGATLQDVQPELVTRAYVAAGNRYGIRYDELAMFILSAI